MFIASSTAVFGGLEAALKTLLPAGITAFEAYELHVPGHPELKHVGVANRSDEELSALRERLAVSGARLCALAGHTDLLAADTDERARGTAHLERCLEAARLLACPIVVTASGHLRGDPGGALSTLVGALRHLGDKATDAGAKVAVEGHYGEFIQSTEDLIRLMEAVDHPAVGVNYDPFHFVFLHENMAQWAPRAAPWVVHTHIHDVARGWSPERPWYDQEDVPGRGVIDYAAMLSALCSVGYGGALSIELHKVFHGLTEDHVLARDFLQKQIAQLGIAEG